MSKLIFMPNVGEDNYSAHTQEDINRILDSQKSADFPKVTSLGLVKTKGSDDGMVPITKKTKR
jgi:hypothetical protein